MSDNARRTIRTENPFLESSLKRWRKTHRIDVTFESTSRHPGKLANMSKKYIQFPPRFFGRFDFHPMLAINLESTLDKHFGRNCIFTHGRECQHCRAMDIDGIKFLHFWRLFDRTARRVFIRHGTSALNMLCLGGRLAASLFAQSTQDKAQRHERNNH